MYGFITKQGKSFTLDIRTSSDVSRGELVAQRFMVSKAQARAWCLEYNARPWNF